MKGLFRVITIGFLSGIFGAFVYHQFIFKRLHPQAFQVNKPGDATENYTQFVTHAEQENRGPGSNEIPGTANTSINFVEASRISTPSVVYIKTVSRSQSASTWMDYFFGNQASQTISSGSGVIYSHDGYIITNNHVIDRAEEIEVTIGKKSYTADVIGTDPSSDLAVLKIDASGLPNISLGASRNLQVGDWVLAVGNPFNLNSTVTAGIVSAKGRELNIVKSTFPIESFIQTDAAINPGNSGGALVNLQGELVGINTAILSRTGTYTGYGFAVPVDIVRKVADDLIDFGTVQKAFFGGEVLDIDSEMAQKLQLDSYNGVVLGFTQADGGAEKAGLQKGDVIVKIDSAPVDSRSEFEELLSYRSPGDRITVTYKRNNKIHTTQITLTNREGNTDLLRREIYSSRTLGADFEKVSKVERDMLKLEHGVRIVKVRNGFIRQMGLEEGFIVVYINKIPVRTPEELSEILEKIRGRVYVEGVNKRGQWQYHRYYF